MELIGTDFENWGPYLMKQFQLMYEKGEKCDLEISCNKQIFLVHRLIMSACSEYIKELGDKQHIILPEEISCKALKMVLDFVYTGKIAYNKEQKEDLLLAANLLNMRLLSELIKMEESCSFTLSMDDETDEKPNDDSWAMNADNLNHTEPDVPEAASVAQPPSQSTYKKKPSEVRSRPRTSRNSVLPPLHKFPYLQQKFSASRTYGLITTLTDPVPSRFEIPESTISECSYRFSFEDVSYETRALINESESFQVLDQHHHQFLNKNRETSNHKRSYSNALYSPFDKYTPPYTVHTETTSRKRENTSYLTKPDPISPKRSAISSTKTTNVPKYHNKNIKTNIVAVEAATVIDPPLIENPNVSNDAAIALHFSNTLAKQLPEKAPEIIEVPSIENGEKVELIKLNNAVVTTPVEDFKSQSISEELPDVSISVIGNETVAQETKSIEAPNSASIDTSFTEFNSPSISELNSVPSEPFNSTESNDIDACILPESGTDVDDIPESILPDSTPIAQNTIDVPSSTNSQIVKSKGTENTQLSKIVEDLCKKNPMFKNKNVRFKLVPVNGPIPDILKDQARINKAILVKKTEVPKPTPKDVEIRSQKPDCKSPSIDNVSGLMECKACGENDTPMKFNSYFEYRTHLHNVHDEPNNPIYCIHCGYKSLKRNVQLHHLLTKHNIEPPSSFKFPKCDKCEYYALNEYYLQKHLACHPNDGMQSVCVCKVAFKNSEALQKHIASGDCKNSKSFTCDFCRCMFDRYVNLKAHVRVCRKERAKPTVSQVNENIPVVENTTKTITDGGKDYMAL